MIDVSLDDFQKAVDKSYWYHIRKKTLLPYEGDLSKNEFLEDLHRKVVSGAYFVSSPRAFIVQSKQQRIARVVPVLGLEDYCVYYFCIKQLEEYLAINRMPNTYGGFSLGGLIRESEEAEIEAIITDARQALLVPLINLAGCNLGVIIKLKPGGMPIILMQRNF